MKSIVILTYGDFPNGEASSVRLYGIAQLFIKLGMQVKIISMSKRPPFIWHNYNGIDYISIRSKKNDLWHRLGNVLFYKKRARKILASVKTPDALMVLSIPIPAILMCGRMSKSIGCELYTDRTEWYSPSEFALGYFSPQYIENDLIVKRIIDKRWKVISISKYLYAFYIQKGNKTVRIPAIMDTTEFPPKVKSNNEKVIIVYAGSPARKDSLSMMIEGLKFVQPKILGMLEFKVIGLTEAEFKKKYMVSDIPKQVVFYGRVPRSLVLQKLNEADFTVLLRNPGLRFTKAGFPSKVAESMSSGTPVISNYTSDLSDYLFDGVNALIVKKFSKESFAQAIERAVKLDKNYIWQMQLNARKTAEERFDYRNYESGIVELLEND